MTLKAILLYTHMMGLTGKLEIITGPMFAGKTTELFRRLVVLKRAGMNVLYVNHSGDIRITEYVFSTHAKSIISGSGSLPTATISSLPNPSELNGFHVIGFDEAHWYPCLNIVNEYVKTGFHIIISGLHSCGKLPTLFPTADDVLFLKAYCSVCWEIRKTKVDAPFTWRYNPNPYTFVGGSEQYKAVCRWCREHHSGGGKAAELA